MKPNTREEAAAVAAFLLMAEHIQPATLIGEREVTLIRAGAERIKRQIAATSKAGSVRGRPTGRNGGRKPSAHPSPAALAKRRERERKKSG